MKKIFLLLIIIFFNIKGFAIASSKLSDDVILSNTRGAINVLVGNYGSKNDLEEQKEARYLLTKMLHGNNSRYRRIALQAFSQRESEIIAEYNEVVNGTRHENLRTHQTLVNNMIAVEKSFNLK